MKELINFVFGLLISLAVVSAVPVQAESGCDAECENETVLSSVGKEDIELLQEAAEKGRPKAQLVLGLLYLEGRDYLPKDAEKAVKWIKRAADNNMVEAAALLGALYLTGEEVECDYEKACEYLAKAARKGHPASQYMYAMQCALGLGREVDADEARIWMNAAAENGDEDAQEFLKENPEWIQ